MEGRLKKAPYKLTLAALAILATQTMPSFGHGPPKEEGQLRKADLIELKKIDPTIRLDVRYATSNNFLGRPVYTQACAFLQRPAARALVRAHRALKQHGYGIVVFDGYRPWSVTKIFWDATPEDKKQFVADPAQGSRHNRGCAVDLSIFNLKTGKIDTMPSAYDEMTDRSHINYQGGTEEQRRLRDMLREAMEREGFAVYEPEWWHYDYKDWSAPRSAMMEWTNDHKSVVPSPVQAGVESLGRSIRFDANRM
jgi:zinc D-Ala-D-Ala dipeptidase